MLLQNLLTSGFTFSADESHLKYRYKLINGMLLTGILTAAVATTLRLFEEHYTLALLDCMLTLLFVGGLLYLRTDKSAFNRVVSIQLAVSFLFMTVLILLLKENHTKLLLYVMVLFAVFALKGPRTGMVVYGIIITILSLLYIAPILFPPLYESINLHLTTTEIVMAMLFYSAIALFNLFASLEQQENLNNIQKANRKIAQQREQLFKQLRTFPITKLPNSLSLNEKIASFPSSEKLALMTLQIDDYILLADEFGAQTAHRIVQESAKTLQRFTSENISLFQVGPYQFSFLCTHPADRSVVTLAENIKNYFEHVNLTLENMELPVSFTMGIATGEHAKLITHANSALHEAQKEGNNNFKVFTDDKEREAAQRENIYWNRKIKEIVNKNMLRLYYQPIVDNRTAQVVKYECLIRAVEEEKVIAPYRFLQAAKTRGILPTITRFVIDESFRYFSDKEVHFTINITAEDLQENYLVSYLHTKSKAYRIEPSRVYLEIVESMTANQTQETIGQFEMLRDMGFRLAIDDFGAEASNLSRLLTYQADIIKIDGQFIKHIDTDINSRRIVETVVYLSRKLGIRTVAEFVHSEEIYTIVKALGVDYSQGYFFGAPQPHTFEKRTALSA